MKPWRFNTSNFTKKVRRYQAIFGGCQMENDNSGRKRSAYTGNFTAAKTVFGILTAAIEYRVKVDAEQQLQVQNGVQDSVL